MDLPMVYPRVNYFHQILVQNDSVAGAQLKILEGRGLIYEKGHQDLFLKSFGVWVTKEFRLPLTVWVTCENSMFW